MGQSSSQLDPPDLSQLETDYGRSVSPTPALSESDGKPDIKRDEAESGEEGVVEEDTIMDYDRTELEDNAARRVRSSPINRRDVYEVQVSPRSRYSRKIRKTSTPPDAKPVIAHGHVEAEVSSDRPHKRRKKAQSSQAAAAKVQVPASQPLPSATQQTPTSDTKPNRVGPRKLAASPAVISDSISQPQVVVHASERQQAIADMVPETQEEVSQSQGLLLQEPVEPFKKIKKRKKRQSAAEDDAGGTTVIEQLDREDHAEPAASPPKVRDGTADRKRTKANKKKARGLTVQSGDQVPHNLEEPDEDEQGEEEAPAWPTSEDPEVQALLNDQDWLNSCALLQVEQVSDDPLTERDKQIRIVTKARNKLRAHCERLLYEQKLFKGMARELQDEDSTLYAEYAEKGTKFDIPERSIEEMRGAKKLQKSMKRLRQSLRESLAQSHVEARRRAANKTIPIENTGKQTSSHADGYQGATDMEDVQYDEAVIRMAAERAKQRLEPVMAADPEYAEGDKSPEEYADEVVEELTQRNEKEAKKKAKQTKEHNEDVVGEPTQRNKQDAKKKAKKTRESASALQRVRLADALVPTPPTSEEPKHKYSALETEGHRSQVTSWLAGQEEVPQGSPYEPPELPPTSRKRKRQSTFRTDDDEEYAEEAPGAVVPEDSNSVTTSVRAEAKNASAKDYIRADMPPPPNPNRKSTEQSGIALDRRRTVTFISGPFDNDEKARADHIFASTMHRENMSRAELVAQIKDWKNATVFKADIVDAFPERNSAAVRRFCQRRYHDQERGPWTEEQDDLLRKAYAGNPDKWTVISRTVGRTGADCKDRWTKQLQYRERDTGPWSLEQEERLLAAIKECLKVIKTGKKDDRNLIRSRDRLEALISWKVVSEKLDGRRTADKCREKYQRLKMAEARDKNANDAIDSTNITSASVKANEASKLAAARSIVNNRFEIGDYYDVFVEIHTSFANHDQHFRDEKNVLWSIVSGKNMQSRFALYHSPGALRRAALEKAIEEWPTSNAKIKKRLAKVDTMPAKALVLANWIEREFQGRLDTMKRTFKTEMIGKSEQDLTKIKQERKEKYKKLNSNRADLSRDYVTDSDDELQDDAASSRIPSAVREQQNGNIDAKLQSSELEDIDAEPQSGRSQDSLSNDEREVPESQIKTTQSPVRDEDLPMTDVESLNGRPNIAPDDFVATLKSGGSGRKRRTVGYGRKEREREERRQKFGR